MLDDALVEALVAAAQQRERRLAGELVDEAVVEQPAARDQRDHAALRAQLDGVDAVEGAQRRVHDVDAQHHAGAAAERRVVDLAARERRVVARVERAHLVAVLQRVAHVALRAEPVEPLREERDHVELHRSASSRPRKRASTSMRRRLDVDGRDRVLDQRHELRRPRRSSETSHDGYGEQPRDAARPRGRRPRRRSPRGRRPSTRPPRARGAAARGARSSLAAQRLDRRCGRDARPTRRIGRASVPARRSTSVSRSPTQTCAPSDSSCGAGSITWNEPSSPCGRPTPAGVQELGGQSTMSTSTRRSVAHGGGLHDGAQRVGGAPAAADDLAVVVVGDRQLEDDRAVVLLELLDLHRVGLVDERADELLEQLAQPGLGGHRRLGGRAGAAASAGLGDALA